MRTRAGRDRAVGLLEMLQFHASAFPQLQFQDLSDLGASVTQLVSSALQVDSAALFLSGDEGRIALAGCHGIDAVKITGHDRHFAFADHVSRTAETKLVRLQDLPDELSECAQDWGLDGGFFVAPLRGTAAEGGELEGSLVIPAQPGDGAGEGAERDHLKMALDIVASVCCSAILSCRSRSYMETANSVLIKARDAAKTAARAKSDFLDNMSHEIRTPLTAIIGYAEILQDELEDHEAAERVSAIVRNSQQLLETIHDILDFTKLDAGNMEVESVECSPAGIVLEAAQSMQPRAVEKGLALSVAFASEIPARIHSDPARLKQIIVSILRNATKFTSHGGVKLIIRMVEPDVDGQARMAFEITDTGIGMTDDQVAALFQAFHQDDGTTTRRFGGTGLGLGISRKLAQLLGGDIVATSRAGKGSRFTVTIGVGPLANLQMNSMSDLAQMARTGHAGGSAGATTDAVTDQGTPPPAQPASSAMVRRPLEGLRILLVEDGPDNQRLVSFILKKCGAQVSVASNGLEGRDTALAARSCDDPYDVILMDMQMPVMDGYTATRELREAGYDGPVIALTAHALEGDRQKCLDAGCNDFAAKPINMIRLITTIVNQLASESTDGGTP